jgi:Zn-dependent hydrolases, including glyoxylases
MLSFLIRILASVCASALFASAQPANWSKPFPAHRIIGNVYYVGTEDLACFLITTPQGHILINTGLEDSVPLIRSSVQSLGFRLEDIKILLVMQAHFDHVAGMAEIQRLTSARMLATDGDAPVLEQGGKGDFLNLPLFPPVKVHGRLKDGQKIRLGRTELNVHLTPGHTRGSVSYSMRVVENGRTYNVLFANLNTMIGAKLVGNREYPNIAKDYARSLEIQRKLPCDIFLAAHGSQYGLLKKYKPGQPYRPDTFVDPDGYGKAVEDLGKKFEEQLRREQHQ